MLTREPGKTYFYIVIRLLKPLIYGEVTMLGKASLANLKILT